jgi:hypothetical protein
MKPPVRSLMLLVALAFLLVPLPVQGDDSDTGPELPLLLDDETPSGAQESDDPAIKEPSADTDRGHENRTSTGDKDGTSKEDHARHHRFAGKGKDPSSVLAGLAILFLAGMALFALQFLFLTTFPAAAGRIQKQVETRRLFSFILGAVNVVFLLLLIGVLGHAGKGGGALAGIFLFIGIFGVLAGMLGRALQIGARASAVAGMGENPVLHLVFGWWTIFFVGIIPVVGWLLALYWAVSGVGSVVLSLFGGIHKAPEPTPSSDEFQSPEVKV